MGSRPGGMKLLGAQLRGAAREPVRVRTRVRAAASRGPSATDTLSTGGLCAGDAQARPQTRLCRCHGQQSRAEPLNAEIRSGAEDGAEMETDRGR